MHPRSIRLGPVTLDADRLLTVGSVVAAAEAMVELGLEPEPPAMWLVEITDLAGFADFRGAPISREPFGIYVHAVGDKPMILVQRGLPPFVQRSLLRHELCHLAQDRAGRFEIFDAGHRGRWWVPPAATAVADETEAAQFGRDARFLSERRTLERTAPPGWTFVLSRIDKGQVGFRLGRIVTSSSKGHPDV